MEAHLKRRRRRRRRRRGRVIAFDEESKHSSRVELCLECVRSTCMYCVYNIKLIVWFECK